MARAARQRRENELPYIPFGPFQIRFPFIHYKIESVEFIQGLILGMDHTDPSADDRIPGRLPYGKRTYPGNDRPADAGWSRVHIYGHHQACG